MKRYMMIILAMLFLAACGHTLSTSRIKSIESIPKTTYEAYVYSSGIGGKMRAVFLKSPETDVEIIPYSVDISKVTATIDQSFEFMRRGSISKKVNVEGVLFQGKMIGYLLTHWRHSFQRAYIEAQLYERKGKIFFTIWESPLSEDP